MSQRSDQTLAPFPAYIDHHCIRCRAEDPEVQRRIELLQAALVDNEPRACLAQRFGLSQGRVSQLIHAWGAEGVSALFRRVPAAPGAPPEPAALRDLLRKAMSTPLITLGTLPSVQRWAVHLPHLIERGLWARQRLQHAVAQADDALFARFQLRQVLAQTFFAGAAHETVMAACGLSRSRLYAVVQEGLAHVHSILSTPSLLEPTLPWHPFLQMNGFVGREDVLQALRESLQAQRCVDIVGLSGVGKTTLAAHLADTWWRAGWNVCWLNASSDAFAGERMTKHVLTFAIDHGLLAQTHVDFSRPFAEHLRTLATVLDTTPYLVVVDNTEVIQASRNGQQFFDILAQAAASYALLVGQRQVRTEPRPFYVQGLEESAAYALYTSVHPSFDAANWSAVYATTAGNPKLLQLWSGADFQADVTCVSNIVGANIAALPPDAQALLAWLAWHTAPLRRDDPFAVHAAAAPSTWQALLQSALLTQQHGLITIHSLVRTHLRHALADATWQAVRDRVIAYAQQAHDWPLLFRCAQDADDAELQQTAVHGCAKDATRTGDPNEALAWWDTYLAVTPTTDTAAVVEAQLAKSQLLLYCLCFEEALALLTTVTPPTALARWRVALLMVATYQQQTNPDEVLRRLQTPPLSEPPPAGTTAPDRWHLTLEWAAYFYQRGNLRSAWEQLERAGPPPETAPVRLRNTYATLGGNIALERLDYKRHRAFAQQFIRFAQQEGQYYSVAMAKIQWGRTLFSQNRCKQARNIFSAVRETLPTAWTQPRWFATIYLADSENGLARFNVAAALVREAHTILEAAPIPRFHAFTLLIEGIVAANNGAYADACHAFSQADALYCQINNQYQRALIQYWCAQLLYLKGNYAQARATLHPVIRSVKALHARDFLKYLRMFYALLALAEGNAERALRHAQKISAHTEPANLGIEYAEAETIQAQAYLALGQSAHARQHAERATAAIKEYQQQLTEAPWIWAVAADAYAQTGDPVHAAQAQQVALAALRYQWQHRLQSVAADTFLAQPRFAVLCAQFSSADHVLAAIGEAPIARAV